MEVQRRSLVAIVLSALLVLALAAPVAAQPNRTALLTDVPVTGVRSRTAARSKLDITAVRGPGNLLGNLLCAVAGLLDGGGPGNLLNNLLRNINRILG
jgi:hypothetical protein